MPSTSASDEARRQAELASLLQQGVAAAQRGQRERAQRLLEAALAIDPANEDAWLWLAAMADNHGVARAMCRRVLEDHPDSARALGALRWLDQTAQREAAAVRADEAREAPPPKSPAEGSGEAATAPFVPPWNRTARPPDEPAATQAPPEPPRGVEAAPTVDVRQDEAPAEEAAPEPTQPLAEEAQAAPPDVQAGEAPAAEARADDAPAEAADADTIEVEAPPLLRWARLRPPRLDASWQWPPEWLRRMPRRERIRDGAMVAMIGLLVIGSLFLLSLLSSPSRATSMRVALGVITETPTITPSPTATLTPSATPTPTHTPTLTPSPTPSPTITLTPSPTPTPEWHTAKVLPLPLDEKWIEVDLTTQTLYAYEGETRVFTATVSTGKGNTPTVQGKFRILRKYESQLMAGPGYYLPNVPYIMYFYGNFALHGAYWHDKWGTPTSHGCVNLKREDAKWLYDWTDPPVPEGAKSVQVGPGQGTWVIVHK